MTRAAVVGGGIGGLAAACVLAKAGVAVDLFERQDQLGGKAGTLTLGAYRFDTGPSLFTMPWVFDGFFRRLERRREDYITYLPLEPVCRYFYPDGARLAASSDTERFAAELEGLSPGASRGLRAYLADSARLWDIAGELFLTRSLHETGTYLSRKGLTSILRLGRIDAARSLHRANAAYFTDPRLVQLFDRYATYNGSDPYRTPATMRIIPHVEYAWGGYALAGGIRSLPEALIRVAGELGVRMHTGIRVEAIRTGHGSGGQRVLGLRAGGQDLSFDLVVSNADVLSTYRELLAQPDAPEARRYEKLEPSSSGLVFLWGVRGRFPQLSTNNIFFSRDYRAEFAALFGAEEPADDLTVYVNITSKTTPGDAPAEGENWFVLVNAPRHRGQDWPSIAARVRAAVLRRLSSELGAEIESLIECEKIITPEDIERETGSTYGSLYGIASNAPLAAFLRHRNRSRRIEGLYFCGGSAHPGGGMPLALLSGTIAAELALRRPVRR